MNGDHASGASWPELNITGHASTRQIHASGDKFNGCMVYTAKSVGAYMSYEEAGETSHRYPATPVNYYGGYYMSLPDGAEYWWKDYPKRNNFLKRNSKKHDCHPMGGIPGSPFRNTCRVCGRGFSKKQTLEYMNKIKNLTT